MQGIYTYIRTRCLVHSPLFRSVKGVLGFHSIRAVFLKKKYVPAGLRGTCSEFKFGERGRVRNLNSVNEDVSGIHFRVVLGIYWI